MSDVNAFLDAVGKDVSATVAPRIDALGKGLGAAAAKVVQQLVDQQTVVVRDAATALVNDIFQQYQPEIAGELHTRIVSDGVEVVGHGVRLDLKRRDTGAVVSSLDVPVSIRIRVDGVSLVLSETLIGLDVLRS